MRGDFDGEMRRRMEDASMLPHDDPRRLAVSEEIASAGGWAQEEWLRLQAEPERLRYALREITAPPGLERRLLEIPTGVTRRRRRLHLPLGAAAVLLVIAAVAIVVSVRSSSSSADQSFMRLASLVVADHAKHPELTVLAVHREQLVSDLQPRAPFEVRLPDASPGGTVLGGRICSFDECPLVLTRWRSGAHESSMYQLRLADFGLPPNLPPKTLTGDDGAMQRIGRCRIRIWSDAEFAYAVVSDDGPADSSS